MDSTTLPSHEPGGSEVKKKNLRAREVLQAIRQGVYVCGQYWLTTRRERNQNRRSFPMNRTGNISMGTSPFRVRMATDLIHAGQTDR